MKPSFDPGSLPPPSAHLVASPLATGSSWLANLLLELRIKTAPAARDPQAGPAWQPHKNGGFSPNPSLFKPLRRRLPALSGRDRFDFESNAEVVWGSNFGLAREPQIGRAHV